MAPSSFTVHLVLDTREVRAKQDRAYMQEELTRRGVTPIMRTLEAGDALWIAKGQREDSAERPSEDRAEVVLDWIVERKRLDDLVGSIKDGRFREQKVCCPCSPFLPFLSLPFPLFPPLPSPPPLLLSLHSLLPTSLVIDTVDSFGFDDLASRT